MTGRPGRLRSSQRRHWPLACGCATTEVMSAERRCRARRPARSGCRARARSGSRADVSNAERVERRRNRALDRVLDGHDAGVGATALDRLEHLGDARALDRLDVRDRQREQRLFREGPGWAEERVASHVRQAPVHSSGVTLGSLADGASRCAHVAAACARGSCRRSSRGRAHRPPREAASPCRRACVGYVASPMLTVRVQSRLPSASANR